MSPRDVRADVNYPSNKKGEEFYKESGTVVIDFDATRKQQVKKELPIYDARPTIGKYEMDTHGFIILNLETKLPQTLEVMKDPQEKLIASIFYPEVEGLAKQFCKLSDGRLPKYAVAIGCQKFIPQPKMTGGAAEYQGKDNIAISYARIAHADFSEVVFDNAYKMLTKRGIPEEEAQNLDLVFVNTWKPYGQTVTDNPMALLDWTSVDVANDVQVHLRGVKATKGAIYGTQIFHNPNHRWLYLPDMRDNEIFFFKQADSRAVNKEPTSLAQYGFHTAFRLPDDPGPDNKTRRSIAVRLLLGYEKPQKAAKL